MGRPQALEQLRSILDGVSSGDDDELSQIVQARDEVVGRYQPLFSDEHLPRLTQEEFGSFLLFENNRHWKGIHRYTGILTADMGGLREALSVLLDESRSLRERLDKLRPRSGKGPVRGLGPATLTPILLVRYPEKYGVLNRVVEDGLKALGLWPVVAASAGFSELYIRVNERLLELATELGIDLWTLDSLFWRAGDLDATQTTWRNHVRSRIEGNWEIGDEFTIDEVYDFEGELRRLYPRNRNVRAKLRQVLQELREEGIIEFVNQNGLYQRVQSVSRKCWWVNQGATYALARQGGFVWAPQRMRNGRTADYHENVRRVSQQDVLLHYAKGAIRALGVAKQDGREQKCPAELQTGRWEMEGYFAPIEYWELEEPIELDDVPIELRKSVKGGPFNVKGRVNQGYLYPLYEEVAERLRRCFSERWPTDSPWEAVAGATYTIDHAHADLFIPLDRFTRLLSSIKSRKNLILQGPPGTGKTFIARRIAWCLIGRKDDGSIEIVQFHQSYAYEDFVQGFRPNEKGGFQLKPGVFHRFCEQARSNPDTPHVFIIDEVNRGNLSRIFGELLMLIEADKRREDYAVLLTYSGDRFHVPENVFILGMMNTADRSLAMVDYALRRRFAFETLEPAYGTEYGRTAFEKYLVEEKGADPDLVTRISHRIDKLNETIRNDQELGRGFQIGHSYFVPDDGDKPTEDWYNHIVDTQIAPLLREYWFDSPEDVEKEVKRLTADA